MKLKVLSNGQDHNLTITEKDDGLQVEIDGRQYQVRAYDSKDGSYLLLNNNQVFACRVSHHSKSNDRFDVNLKGEHHAVAIIDPRRLRSDENSDRHHDGLTEISSQMPGKVVRVLVEVGAKVEKGDGMIVVEAMKMQNEMKSPRDGVVISLAVSAGDTVNAGELLATVGEAET